MAEAPLIQGLGIETRYGASRILHGVDFAVAPRECVALMGRNGMGKTTLLRTLLGLVPAAAGEIRAGGRSVTGMAPHRIARMGIAYVPEGRGIFGTLSVRENLVMAARPGRDGRLDWTYDRVLATFPRLAERLGHGGNQLSGGEQQMLTIGRALMTNPDLIILDEATEGLAPKIAQEIWAILHAVKATGIASVIVDKSFHAVSRIADRSVLLVKGRVVFDGPSAELAAKGEFLRQNLGV
jgi:branched-chain amino acid transport system ATP-binding protein